MIEIKFKNLARSEIVMEAAHERVEALRLKFPDLRSGMVLVTLEMENSPIQAGPDLFKVRLHVSRGRYKGIIVEKSDANLYVALAEVADNLLETLNRFGDRARVKERKSARKIARVLERQT